MISCKIRVWSDDKCIDYTYDFEDSEDYSIEEVYEDITEKYPDNKGYMIFKDISDDVRLKQSIAPTAIQG